MHYVPESARDFLPDEPVLTGRLGERERGFHYQSAPVYLLTLVVGALLGADLLMGLIGDPAWGPYRAPLGHRLVLWAAVLGGWRILYQTYERLLEGRVGADLALTVAAFAAIILGETTTAALVVFIALCGESIEGYTIDRAQSAIRRVFDLCPDLAHVVRGDREVDVAVADLCSGDVVTIRPGERIPVDGIVTAGVSTVDQSPLTGESFPVDKASGAEVFTGTLNQYGSLSVLAQKVGAETTLAKVLQLVAEATRQKTPLERTADRLARIFLPFVLAAALLTLVAWRFSTGNWSDGIKPALAILVVACPCPLILATPTAVVAAMAWLARTGVVVKGSIALEQLATVDTFAFDKTGTLTRGELKLDTVFSLPSLTQTELLRVAAIAERRSEHLLARLIVREAESRNVVVPATDEFASYPGAGVVATVRSGVLGPWADALSICPAADASGHVSDQMSEREDSHSAERLHTVVVGNRALVDSQKIAIGPAIEEVLLKLEQSGATTLLVAVNNQALGVIGVRDAVRDESRLVIAELKRSGVRSIALLTGDRAESAQTVASSLGLIDDVESGLLPAEKARWIETRIREGRRVAMVGDGVNDAPALAVASVGLALGGVGSGIAAEAGDLVLMGDPLRPLPGLLRLSQALVRNIRQSIYFFAFGLNAGGILACGLGFLSPVGGALFHEFAALAVMLNAMRLLWFERWDETSLGRNWAHVTATAEWIAEALSPTRWVHRLLDNWSMIVGLAVPAVVCAWLMTGVVCIRENERAVVTRFGRAEADLTPGLYWRFPFPFERIYREPVGQLRTVQIGFRARQDKAVRPSAAILTPVEWTSAHNESGFETRPEESLMLTGNEVLVEMTAEVQWRISDLRTYLFGSAQPEEVLRAISENVLREMAARQALDGILTEQRGQLQEECLALLRSRVKSQPLGIDVAELALLDVHPPRDVVSAYRDVADALEEQEQSVNEAEAYYGNKLLGAAGEGAVRMLNQATADTQKRSDQSTTGAVAAWTMTDETWSKLTREDATGNSLLSGESASVLLAARQAATSATQAARGDAARFNELLNAYQAQPRLTSSHLYWQAIVNSLSDKAVIVVDPKAGGHKRLFLGGPEDLQAGSLLKEAESEGASPAARSEPSSERSLDERATDPERFLEKRRDD